MNVTSVAVPSITLIKYKLVCGMCSIGEPTEFFCANKCEHLCDACAWTSDHWNVDKDPTGKVTVND